jgi:hypothetical protein
MIVLPWQIVLLPDPRPLAPHGRIVPGDNRHCNNFASPRSARERSASTSLARLRFASERSASRSTAPTNDQSRTSRNRVPIRKVSGKARGAPFLLKTCNAIFRRSQAFMSWHARPIDSMLVRRRSTLSQSSTHVASL